MTIEFILTMILSSTVVSSIVVALFSLLSNRKREFIENITKERKEWRDELRKIVEDITKCADVKQFQVQIEKLKVRINPYGQSTSLFFDDSYIWEYIDELKSETKKFEKTRTNVTEIPIPTAFNTDVEVASSGHIPISWTSAGLLSKIPSLKIFL